MPRIMWLLLLLNHTSSSSLGINHAVITNNKGQHLTIPMHKPIKPLYITRFIQLIEEQL